MGPYLYMVRLHGLCRYNGPVNRNSEHKGNTIPVSISQVVTYIEILTLFLLNIGLLFLLLLMVFYHNSNLPY